MKLWQRLANFQFLVNQQLNTENFGSECSNCRKSSQFIIPPSPRVFNVDHSFPPQQNPADDNHFHLPPTKIIP